MRRRAWSRALLVVLFGVMVATGCGGGSTPSRDASTPIVHEPPHAPAPSVDLVGALMQRRLDDLLAGASAPPFVMDWPSIQSGTLLPAPQKDRLCEELDGPHVDTVISSILAVGVNWLLIKVHREPLAEDSKQLIEIGTTFAVKTCPLWRPSVFPTTTRPPTPLPAWYPAAYQLVSGDPNVAWKWVDGSTFPCKGPGGSVLAGRGRDTRWLHGIALGRDLGSGCVRRGRRAFGEIGRHGNKRAGQAFAGLDVLVPDHERSGGRRAGKLHHVPLRTCRVGDWERGTLTASPRPTARSRARRPRRGCSAIPSNAPHLERNNDLVRSAADSATARTAKAAVRDVRWPKAA